MSINRRGVLAFLYLFFALRSLAAQPNQQRVVVRESVLVQIEKELKRLDEMANQDTKSHYPPAAGEVAYLLLKGLAAQSVEIKQPSPEDLRKLGIAPSKPETTRLFTVGKDIRLAISKTAIQDKAGTYTSKDATLYRRQDEKWIFLGRGMTAVDGIESAD